MQAVSMRDIVAVHHSLDNGADPNFMTAHGMSALMYVTYGGRDIASLLLDSGASVNLQNERGGTALMKAVCNSNTDIVSLLLSRGADPNVVRRDGCTSLMLASLLGFTEIVLLLLDYGADTSIVGNDGKTAVTVAKTDEIRDMIFLCSRSIHTNKDRSRGFMSERYEDMDVLLSS